LAGTYLLPDWSHYDGDLAGGIMMINKFEGIGPGFSTVIGPDL
jgi:hypothetical protein